MSDPRASMDHDERCDPKKHVELQWICVRCGARRYASDMEPFLNPSESKKDWGKREYDLFLETWFEWRERAERIAMESRRMRPWAGYVPKADKTFFDCEFEPLRVVVRWDEFVYGQSYPDGENFPPEYLWDPEWKKKLAERVTKEKKERAKREHRKGSEAKEERRRIYEELKKEFEK